MAANLSNWILLLPAAFTLFVGMRLTNARFNYSPKSTMAIAMRLLVVIMFVYGLVPLVVSPSLLTIPWLLVFAAVIIVLGLRTRRLQRTTLLTCMMSTEDDDQRLRVLRSFGEAGFVHVRRLARRILKDLELGGNWSRSAERHRLARTVYEKILTRNRERYRDELNGTSDWIRAYAIESQTEHTLNRFVVLLWLATLLPLMLIFLFMIFPTLIQLGYEFRDELPYELAWIRGSSQGSWLGRWLGMAVGVGVLIVVAILLLLWFPRLRQLPIVRWFFDAYYSNAGLFAFHSVLKRGAQRHEPLAAACDEVAGLIPVRYVAKRYRKAARLLEAGVPMPRALSKSRILGNRDCAALHLLSGSEAGTQLAWAIEQIAEMNTRRMLRRYSVVSQVVIVAATVFFSVSVAFTSIGVFRLLQQICLEASSW